MLTETVSPEFAKRLEFAELNAWWDQWEGFPDELVRQFRFGKQRLGEVAIITSGVIPFSHFNQVIGLGLSRPATEEELDTILGVFRAENVKRFELHHIPHTQTPESRRLAEHARLACREWMGSRLSRQ